MAVNKFATMLHRNTNKMTLILVYTVLEWILIILLLLNSLFSYLIFKFANYFGLKPPCLWCSRVDHILEPGKKNMHNDLLCEAHAEEISKLGFCLNHKKLAESQDMCEDCSSSRPDVQNLLPWMKQVGLIPDGGDKYRENDEVGLSCCSCCGVGLSNKILSPYIVIKPSWDFLDYTQKGNLVLAGGDVDNLEEIGSDFRSNDCEMGIGEKRRGDDQVISDDGNGGGERKEDEEEPEDRASVSVSESRLKEVQMEREVETENNLMSNKEDLSIGSSSSTSSPEIIHQHLEFFIDCSGRGLVEIELIDSMTDDDQSKEKVKEEEEEKIESEQTVGREFQLAESGGHREAMSVPVLRYEEEPNFLVLEAMEMEEDENSLVFHAKEYHPVGEKTQSPSQDITNGSQAIMAAQEETGKEGCFPPISKELSQMPRNESEADISIGTEIPDLDSIDEVIPNQEPSTSSSNLEPGNIQDSKKAEEEEEEEEEEIVEFRTLSVEVAESSMNNRLTWSCDLNEIEEDKFPDTPTSIDSLHNLNKKLLMLEKMESGGEEYSDGSVVSEQLEGIDGVVSIERLKSALRAERKRMQALYAELEEERSASAVAANQTMAMINRLQEEKAAMQMEALQYQRMMEEQSEYDQEALHLMNELMVKKEKEKQELEKELELYRRRVFDYEANKERMKVLKNGNTRSGFSSASCSNAEDSDGLSIDLNQEVKEEDGFYGHHENGNLNTPLDAVLNLDESLADFEEERLSILEQLKVLERRLFALDDEGGDHGLVENLRPPIQDFHGENGNGEDTPNGFDNGKHHQEKRILGAKGKKLLPLFDATSMENGDGELNGHGSDLLHDSSFTISVCDSKKETIEEEVDHLYERLQALEADREFLKHCMISLKKGGKGMDLLQEILLHLRDLRNMELRVRNLGDGVLV